MEDKRAVVPFKVYRPRKFVEDDVLNDALNLAIASVKNEIILEAQERVLRSVPELVMIHLLRQKNISGMVERFFKEHKEFKGSKVAVATILNKVSSENPGWTIEQCLNETARKAKKILEVKGDLGVVQEPVKQEGSSGLEELSDQLDDILNEGGQP